MKVAEFLQEIMVVRMRYLWGDQIPEGIFDEVEYIELPKDFVFQPQKLTITIPLVPDQRSQSPNGYGSFLEQGQGEGEVLGG